MKSLTLKRIAAVDVFRALTMFLMLFVNDIPGLKNVPHWLMHGNHSVSSIIFIIHSVSLSFILTLKLL